MTLRRDHWMRRNDTSWSPRRVVVIDAEGSTAQVDGGELDTFRLACASFTIREGDHDAAPRTETTDARTPAELWRQINRWCHSGRSTWLVAHGLHYDYTVTAAHRELPELGWELVDWSTRAGSRWVRWRRGRSALLMVDLFNYLPMPLEQVGKLLGLAKFGMPKQDARERTWLRYCRRDVDIAREAFLRLLEWWDRSDLGRWGFTSGACALAAFRHRHLKPRTIRAHDEPRARTLERESLFGGRREIYRQGRLAEGVWADLDYVSHYAITAGSVEVPVRLVQLGKAIVGDPLERLPEHTGIIARVEVEVDEPVAPFRHPSLGVIYPIGRFTTTLAGPELELVKAHGRIVRWLEAALYHLEPALESWADWLLPMVTGTTTVTDPVVRPLLKDWTRSLIGKFGQRKPHRVPEQPAGTPLPDAELTVVVGAGSTELPWSERTPEDPCRGEDAYNAVPAITAWVHSAARVWLWEGMTAAGRADIAYVDTDGFLVQVRQDNLERLAAIAPQLDAGAATVQGAVPEPAAFRRPPTDKERRSVHRPKVPETPTPLVPAGTLQVKGRYGGVVVHRPQDYELDRAEVIKGLPRARRKLAPRVYEAEFWPGMPWQLDHGSPGTYLRAIRTVHLTEDYLRGWVLSDGRVAPLEVTWGAQGLEVLPFHRTRTAGAGGRLKDPAQARRVLATARSPGPQPT